MGHPGSPGGLVPGFRAPSPWTYTLRGVSVAELHVELVAADREVWSGEARMVIARTLDGDIGILPGHVPVLGVLESGPVRIDPVDGETVMAAVHGGFLSVADNGVSVLAEGGGLAAEVDGGRGGG